jgi:adhesin/invasin
MLDTLLMKLVAIFLSLSCGLLFAAPELRLATAAIGPVYIASGQNGPAQTVAATNIGSGTLSLSASANMPWLTASIGASNTIQIALATSTLTAGQYSGVVTVLAPGAIDAPQNISVTVQIGSPVPSSIDLYVAPGGTASTTFSTATTLSATVKNPQTGPVLSVTAVSPGFFSPPLSFTITATAAAGTAAGDYSGSIVASGSTSAADNKTISVTIHVTSQPIVAQSPASLTFRLAPGAPPATQAVVFSNTGMGTLTLGAGVSPPTPLPIPPPWLSETIQGDDVLVSATPGAMSPGTYQASIAIPSNAANSPSVIPVTLVVLTPGPPVAYYRGVLDNALFAAGDPLAPGGIVAVFGEQLGDVVTQAQSLPLGTSLGGATVVVNGLAAPIYYASPDQLNFQIPYETAPGPAVVEVQRDGQTGNSVSITVQSAVPRLLPLGIGSYGIALLGASGTFAIPATPGIPSRPAQAGVDTVVFYALGLGQTSPPAQDGAPSPAGQIASAEFVIGQTIFAGTGVTVTPAYAGLTPGSVGLYQINVAIPANSIKGSAVPVYLDMGGGVLSNRVDIAIQ